MGQDAGLAGQDLQVVPTLVALTRGLWAEPRLRAFLVAPPVPSAWPLLPSPFLSAPAARLCMRKIPENDKGGGRGRGGRVCSARGGHCFLLSALPAEIPRVGDPPRVLATRPRERAPRIAAATTCSPHVACGPGGAVRQPEHWVWRSGGPVPRDVLCFH